MLQISVVFLRRSTHIKSSENVLLICIGNYLMNCIQELKFPRFYCPRFIIQMSDKL